LKAMRKCAMKNGGKGSEGEWPGVIENWLLVMARVAVILLSKEEGPAEMSGCILRWRWQNRVHEMEP